ncbi:MAG: IPT/TIG domain-containing protein [Desulfomicrobium escambiense]|nr:IPT/TIG domain-containing protein [Desulfomicrobium escambiense]
MVVGPTVLSVSPTSGPTAGGTEVTISGANFVTGADGHHRGCCGHQRHRSPAAPASRRRRGRGRRVRPTSP